MNKDLVAIFEYLEREKGIKRSVIVDALEESLLIAARKSLKGLVNVAVQIDSKSGEITVSGQKEVVEIVELPEEEMSLDEAREINPEYEIGDWVDITVSPDYFGRIAAQTARQVISQKLRGAEKDVIYEEYRHRIHDLISGSVKRIVRGGTLIIDLGKVEGILPDRYYPRNERYNVGERVHAMIYEVRDTENGGAEVVLTRNHVEFVTKLFEQEVPEINEKTVIIERIVRDPGYRTKVAVRSSDSKVDPVGATVGVRGTRVKNIIRELNNEKIDIVPFSEDRLTLLQHMLAPVEIRKVSIDDDKNEISIVVEDEDYPTVLGKRGMNARLNGKLLDVELNVQKMSEYHRVMAIQSLEITASDDPWLDEPLVLEGISSMITEALISGGYDTPRKIFNVSEQQLAEIPGISADIADKVMEQLRKKRV